MATGRSPPRLHVARRTAPRRCARSAIETQSDIAAAIGVSRSAVSLWLDGKVGVPRPVAMLLRMLIAARRRPYLTLPREIFTAASLDALAPVLGNGSRGDHRGDSDPRGRRSWRTTRARF